MEKIPQHTRQEKLEAFGRVLDVLDTLRVKCPWDAKQTNESLRPNTMEEVCELCEALINEDDAEIRKELGDVLLHVLFYAKIGEEKGAFDVVTVCDSLASKLIYRHPHVYGQTVADNAHQVELNWEQIKLKEKDGNRSVLAGVPSTLPALNKAYRIQEKAANSGFDWADASDVWDKVREEIGEFSAEAEKVRMLRHKADATPEEISAASERMESEMGDVFFSLVNAARLYGVIPENALEKTNKKFISRFNYIEKRAREAGRKLNELTLDEMEAYWQEAKDKS
ncbi:MAG: nucleoside triphosphate pyrophosphohydrolase [Muribaculaceae bacterium]|nr:nucleoside triphosphate pyrophosphohydrolase [Muribaculaceae bacterium]